MKILRNLGLIVPLLLGACDGSKPKEPIRSDYDNQNGVIQTKQGKLRLIDENKDSIVDVIMSDPQRGLSLVLYIGEGHKTRYQTTVNTVTMTAEVRDLASKIYKLEQDFNYVLDKESYQK